MYTYECASCACLVTTEARSHGTGILGNYERSNKGARNLAGHQMRLTAEPSWQLHIYSWELRLMF